MPEREEGRTSKLLAQAPVDQARAVRVVQLTLCPFNVGRGEVGDVGIVLPTGVEMELIAIQCSRLETVQRDWAARGQFPLHHHHKPFSQALPS